MYAPVDRLDSRRLHALAHRRGPRGRLARVRIGKMLRASPRAEAGYVRALVRTMVAAHRAMLEHVEPRMPAVSVRHDDERDPVIAGSFLARLLLWVRQRVGLAFDEMAEKVDAHNERGLSLLGIEPRAAGVLGYIAIAREANLRLIDRALRAYADDVRAVFSEPRTVGLRVEEIAKMLEPGVRRAFLAEGLEDAARRATVRASLIARDQTLKTNAAVSRARMRAAGVTDYGWSTSRDERVRPMHAALEGRRFAFDDPPVTNQAGETNNPGEDIQCRCIPIPYIAELDEPAWAEVDQAAE